ncbi:archaemetzincin [Flavobacterium capsici]|uniref:Archaemetzincin n=1 Tax=Flavobacterium capsici TaxID=3075618 RepID=A0AA96F3Z1_9FLAO|nr:MULTISPECIES: archaemetzincin [unclassified Flavobacterium]WNM18174.1 archaemetzincin [Flavobacterium sp. PMR2A8]WNM22225.1 archaemetzincin [Flavobacterium sp. PMTSA4]
MKRNTVVLLILILFSSCQKEDNDYFIKVSQNDQKLSVPSWNDWRSQHNEKGQTFEAYLKCKKATPNAFKKTIYLTQIGEFDELQTKQINLLKEYLSIFFQLDTKSYSSIATTSIPDHAKRIGQEGQEQLLTRYILDTVLMDKKSFDAVALMAISEKDLYPSPDWNYVFGQASYEKHVAVSSIYRFQDEALSESNFKLSLTRLLKVSSHEIGHMFGLNHCIDADCVMNGSNNMPETDRNSSRLCSKCQKKLHYNLKYDNLKRLKELIYFFKRNELPDELLLLEKDLSILQ